VRYHCRRLLLTSLLLIASLASLRAQGVSGRVIGMDLKPDGATVTVLDPQRRVMGEVVVAEDGSFTFDARAVIGSIVVRQEAVSVTRGVVGGADHGVLVDLRMASRWIRSVTILDPAGVPAVGVDVLLRDANKRTLACVTSDASGSLIVRGNRSVASMLIDPLGWQHAVVVKFGASKLQGDVIPNLVIDMRPHAHKFAFLQGSVVDIAGDAVGDARVTASKKWRGKIVPCGFARTKPDGSFKLWTPLDAVMLAARSGGIAWEIHGDWSAGGVHIVRLDERIDGLVMVSGTVKDQDDKVIVGAIIHVSQTAVLAKGSRGIAASDRNGDFRAFVRRDAPFLIVDLRDGRGRVAKAGPWPQQNVKIRPAK
jgi:hypothetical protein